MNESAPPGLPRWVKISAAVVTLLVLVLIAVMVAGGGGGGEHGPGRHGAEGAAEHTTTVSALSTRALG